MSYGLSYMGSKAGVIHLIQYIIDRHYKEKYFVDVFVGGGAVSHYVLDKTNMDVYANDLNKYIVALLEELFINKGVSFRKVAYDFVTREKFFDVINNPNKYDNWYVGYVMTIWSFGNRGVSYIYGQEIMLEKEIMHNAIVFNDFTNFPFEWRPSQYILDLDYKENILKRNEFMREFKTFIGSDYQNHHLERLVEIDNIMKYDRVEVLERFDRLDDVLKYDKATERMQHLSYHERIDANRENYNRLKLSNKDWFKFISSLDDEILENAIIYCDPPYEDTASYQVGADAFNHDEFWDWFRTTPYTVYVSSYKAPDDIKPLNYDYKLNSFNSLNRNVMTENIYWNGKGDAIPTMEDLLFNDD